MPFTAGMPKTMWAMRLSIPSNMGEPMPAGRPQATHSMTPPTESPSRLAAAMAASMCLPATSSIVGRPWPQRSLSPSIWASSDPTGSALPADAENGTSSTSATERRCAAIVTPRFSRTCRAMAPAAQSGAVSLPEKCPPPLGSWLPCHLAHAVRSACPGRGIVRRSE